MQVASMFLVLVALSVSVANGSPNVPIWELLTHKEKMGRLMYVFSHLVHNYCKGSNIPDCDKVLTLYGMSNLVNEDDNALNRMDPYQRNSYTIIWEKVMRGDFKLTNSKSFSSNSIEKKVQAEDDYDYINEIGDSPTSYQVNQRITKLSNDPHPYAVRVPAPAKITAAHAKRVIYSNLLTSDFDKVEDNLDNAGDYGSSNSDIAVGSSHPYAVKVRPETGGPVPIPVGFKSNRDFEPMMMESQVHEIHALPPTLTILTGK